MSWNNQPPAGYGQAPAGYGAYGAPSVPAGYAGGPPQGQPQMYGAPPSNAPQYGGGPPLGQQHGYNVGPAPPPNQQPYGGMHAPPPGSYGQPPAGYAGGGGYAPPPPQGPPPGVSYDLWQWFQAVDADRSGKITSAELQQALMNGNWTPFNEETCRLMIGMFDRDRNGTIDIQEFSSLWKYIQDWKSCFDRFDTDKSGNISTGELHNAFKTFGYNLSPNFCNLCVRVFDKRHTNTMNFDDFIQSCVMLKSLTEQFRQKDTNQSGVIRIHYEEFLMMALDNAFS